MDINKLSQKEKDLIIKESMPILELTNKYMVTYEELKMIAEFCTVTGYIGKDLRELLQCINPNMSEYSDEWHIPKSLLKHNLRNFIDRQRTWLSILSDTWASLLCNDSFQINDKRLLNAKKRLDERKLTEITEENKNEYYEAILKNMLVGSDIDGFYFKLTNKNTGEIIAEGEI